MSFAYEITLFCDGCGDSFDSEGGVARRKELPSEKRLIKSTTGWKFIKDKQVGYKAYCPKCQERMKKEKEK